MEIKSSATPEGGMAAGIVSFRSDYGKHVGTGFVVHMGEMLFPVGALGHRDPRCSPGDMSCGYV